MKPHWILIANASHARLLQQEQPGAALVQVKAFEHPASRVRSSTLGDDRAGREMSDRGYGGAAFEPRLGAQRKEHLEFARELADHLEAAARHGLYESVAVFASSPFLGELKAALGDATRRALDAAHDVDLSSVGIAELQRRIDYELARPR